MKIIDSSHEIPQEYDSYLSDESNLKGKCNKIFFPENTEEIKELLNIHYNSNVPLTIANGRTGIVGGAVPFQTDLICLDRLNNIKSINDKILTLECGVSLREIDDFLKQKKAEYHYPVDVTEDTARIGGTIATDASGSRSFYYGSTRRWVNAFRVILADGKELYLKRGDHIAHNHNLCFSQFDIDLPSIREFKVKNTAGYYITKNMDLLDLFIGSEGTLGVITDIEIKLIERPDKVMTLLCFFNEEVDAVNFFFQAYKEIKDVYAFEFFDENSLQILSNEFNVKTYKGALLIEFHNKADTIEKIDKLMQYNHSDIEQTWAGENEIEKRKIHDFRHRLPETINSIISKRKNQYPELHKISTDIAVPMENLHKMIEFYHETMTDENIQYTLFGHIGEAHLHLNMIPADLEQFNRAKELNTLFIKKAIILGGTFSAEHGVGRIKRDYMKYLFNHDEIQGMKNIKKILDPKGILNPGVIFE